MAILLSMDLGTQGARVGAFDELGRLLASAQRGYSTDFPRPGWAEQNPLDWWEAVVQATREVMSNTEVRNGGDVAGIGVATTASTVTILDRAGQPIRPAILWMDARSTVQAEQTGALAGKHNVLAFSGGADAVEWLVPKAMWLARTEPTVYARAHRIVEAVDYLTWRLTGQWVGSRMNATCKWNFDSTGIGFPTDLYADLGIPELATKLPEDIRRVGEPAGTLAPDVADELGISGAPVVATGGIDAHVSLLGCGHQDSGLVSVVAGTSTAIITEVAEPIYSPTFWGPYPDALHEGRWLIEGGQVSSGSVISWLAQSMLSTPMEDHGTLVSAASALEPCRHGLLVLDYFMGNRTPFRDARLRGGIMGLTLETTPAELYRATTEAVAYGTRSVFESWNNAGIPVDRIVLSGGIRLNSLWLKTTVDVLGREVELVESDNLTLLAGAVQAAYASGLYRQLEQAAEAFQSPTRVVEPDPSHREDYEAGYARYIQGTESMRDLLHGLADLTGQANENRK